LKSLVGLNPEQRKAVEYIDGPELIFAGAGSGKTKVLIHKIAYLIEKRVVGPRNILAVTFTNKAANELKERIESFFGKNLNLPWVGTFHSICARILRKEIHHLGMSNDFTIYDVSDQIELLKSVVEENNISLGGFEIRDIHRRISFLKNKMASFNDNGAGFGYSRFRDELIKKCYNLYQQALIQANALDFDDLLLYPLKLFDSYPEILEKYRNIFQYILVDEYQDTNKPQFYLVNALARKHRRICVVGDDDQSIYSWRGAEIENILRFDEAFPDCQVFKLEQNYRSTKVILKAATEVVRNNENRADKTLWSNNENGEPITLIEAMDEYDEAYRIAGLIEKEILRNKRAFKDFAVLYRINAQSRVLEEAFRRSNIVYTIVGGVKFFERKEIKDMLAYFRVFLNPKDNVSMKRIINFPARGIGKITLSALESFAREKKVSLYEALAYVDLLDLDRRQKTVLKNFYELVSRFHRLLEQLSFEEWAHVLIDELGIRNYYKNLGDEESLNRLANIEELLSDISEFSRLNEEATLSSYLESVSLISDIDTWDDEKNAVSLMTLHSAKGLEFPVIFICGLNEKLFPLERDGEIKNIEEERRLFYVGLTRAKEKVYLSTSTVRNVMGVPMSTRRSIFLEEIPPELVMEDESHRSSRIAAKRKKSSMRDMSGSMMNTNYKSGDVVNHRIFGTGKVIGVDGYGENAKLRIHFGQYGVKTIVAKYLN